MRQPLHSALTAALFTALVPACADLPAADLGQQIVASSGDHLSAAQTRQRMSELGTLLLGAGYHNRGTLTLGDGTRAALWSHAGRRITTLIVSGTGAGTGYFEASGIAGIVRWSEVRGLP